MGIGKRLSRWFRRPPAVSVLRLSGPIGSGGFGRSMDLSRLDPLIERAFQARRLAAVALAINSPGGAPVQSALIASRIRDLAEKKKVPVFAFCEDVAASGGYWLACAGDEIYVDENSIVGSIGVVSAGFGFTQAIDKLGVERRVWTAGENKWRLDPFLPAKLDDEIWLRELQTKIHLSFINYVKARRGAKLGEHPDDALFTGEAFLGADAIELGLADGVGRLRPVLEARFGENVEINVMSQRRSFFSRLIGGAQRDAAPQADAIAAEAVSGVFDEIERRAMLARFGL